MKKILLIIAMLASFVNASSSVLPWQTNFDIAFAQAKKSNKNIMIMIESEQCRWCHKMHETTFKNSTVTKALNGYILLKANRDDAKLLASFPAVAGVPTILFVTPNKKILTTAIGYVEPFDFLSYLRDAKQASLKIKK